MKLIEESFSRLPYESPEAIILTFHSPQLLAVFSPIESELGEWDDIGELSSIEDDLN